ncbi:Isoprenylcysteine carboxyl methyltransferase (ICMT) family protein [Planctomycetes bacterium CA13]|uniref:Isoprenylcysteine carboxyl methyltransferase (ICMT) family protein n=1 Tax=Novipirellula herctigrandis TaxID=2527986 RepID=A0A5C5Z799_9BACT|nr:Isoprenylcysteine carboxyl methyltransferase (ICMT) family protein [Planctomycetes bacterium CA13]
MKTLAWLSLHLIHGLILTLPTMVLAPSSAIDWRYIWFMIGVLIAAILESSSQHIQFDLLEVKIHDPLAMRVASFVGLLLLLGFWAAQIERLFGDSPDFWMSLLGAAGLAIGIALRIVAIRTLGKSFVSDIQAYNTVVRTGIYKWFRHPSEIGLLLISIGAALLLGSPHTAILGALLLTPISLWRMRREDLTLAS